MNAALSEYRTALSCNANSNPQISVVIPLFNKAESIVATLDSVFAQSYPALEIVVVDDGSTDGGSEIVSRFPEVRLIHQANAGVSAARNRGIKECRGDLVAFVDADDQWMPHFLEEIAALVRRFPEAGVFATGYQFCIAKDKFKDPKVRYPKAVRSPQIMDNYFEICARGDLPFMMSSIAVRRSGFDRIGLFVEGEAMGEDQDLFSRAALQLTIAFSPRVLSIYHLDAENRACERNVPDDECPFSRRVRVLSEQIDSAHLRSSMLDYCAAHVIHLASRNVRSGRLDTAKVLLADEITHRHQVRRIWWMFRTKIKQWHMAGNGISSELYQRMKTSLP